MSNNETWFIKILALVLVLGLNITGCADVNPQAYTAQTDQKILGGQATDEGSELSQKVLYLSLGSQLLKTPGGGISAKQTGECTAVAISPQVILTAGHCVDIHTPDKLNIILGMAPWKTKFRPEAWYGVEKVTLYPAYKKNPNGGSENDLALLKLKKPLPSGHVIQLATADKTQPVMNFTMIGFGKRSAVRDISKEEKDKISGELYYLVKATQNYLSTDEKIRIDQSDFKGICSGDSGGPGLIFDAHKKQYLLVGVVSGYAWTQTDKNTLDPENQFECYGDAIYTNILNPDYAAWIKKTAASL